MSEGIELIDARRQDIRSNILSPIEVVCYLTEIRDRIDRDTVYIFYFIDIVRRDKEVRIPSSDRMQDTGK